MDQNPVFTLQQRIIASLGLPPTVDQQQLIGALSEFYLVAEGKHLFVLKGYAGTGKTSVMGAFVKALTSFIGPNGKSSEGL